MGIKIAGGSCQPGPFEQYTTADNKTVSLKSRVGHRNTFSNGEQMGDMISMRRMMEYMEVVNKVPEPIVLVRSNGKRR